MLYQIFQLTPLICYGIITLQNFKLNHYTFPSSFWQNRHITITKVIQDLVF